MSKQPIAPSLDLKQLWVEAHDIPNGHVRETMKKLVEEGFRHEVDETRIGEVSTEPYVYPECLRPDKAEIIDVKFIKELKTGRYIVNKNIKIQARIPIFIKQEGPTKFRVIPNYSWNGRNGNHTSINELIPYNSATMEVPSTKEMVRFVDGDGKNSEPYRSV